MVAHLMYVTCIENAGHWSCALTHWNRTAEYISADEESADKENPWMKFSWPRAGDQSSGVSEDLPSVMWNVKCVVPRSWDRRQDL